MNELTDARDWFRQAEADLVAVGYCASLGDHYLAVSTYRQAAEKALKAVLVCGNKEFPKTHDLDFLGRVAGLPKSLLDEGRWLSSVFIPSRYGYLGGKIPSEYFVEKHSSKAASAAEGIVEWCRKQL